tara:strand:- start:121 stop:351 length:231 start_codon:yes stop_codon:yes gene_type:complete
VESTRVYLTKTLDSTWSFFGYQYDITSDPPELIFYIDEAITTEEDIFTATWQIIDGETTIPIEQMFSKPDEDGNCS